MLRSTDPIKVKVRGGFSLLDMKRFVETRGFKGAAYKGLSMDDLLTPAEPHRPDRLPWQSALWGVSVDLRG